MASRQAKHQAAKRLKGLCSYGGCQDYTGWAYRCLKHEAQHRRRMQARREAARPPAPDEEKAA